jgi:hypothetical protein
MSASYLHTTEEVYILPLGKFNITGGVNLLGDISYFHELDN